MVERVYLFISPKMRFMCSLLEILDWFQKPLCIIASNSYFYVYSV